MHACNLMRLAKIGAVTLLAVRGGWGPRGNVRASLACGYLMGGGVGWQIRPERRIFRPRIVAKPALFCGDPCAARGACAWRLRTMRSSPPPNAEFAKVKASSRLRLPHASMRNARSVAQRLPAVR